MANRERTGWRDYAYSSWHRRLDDRLSFLDIDWIERCDAAFCHRVLAVCELAYDNGRNDDHACWTTRRIAKSLEVRGYFLLYSTDRDNEITGFRVKRIWRPERTTFEEFTPEDWAKELYRLRWCHEVAVKPLPVPAVAAPRSIEQHQPEPPLIEPEWRLGWHCIDCRSLPATKPLEQLGDYGQAHCANCGATRVFRKSAA